VRVYGGWGFDLIDLRASTIEDNGLNDGPVPDLVNNGTKATITGGSYVEPTLAASTYGTPAWEALAYGGAGQDMYFAGTGGDRLIDWVGNHNSYYVPFSQFGMPAVSRTLMPFLPEFLYALSKSDGADQTLGTRADLFCASAAGSSNPACSDYPTYSGTSARNGEPFGELGQRVAVRVIGHVRLPEVKSGVHGRLESLAPEWGWCEPPVWNQQHRRERGSVPRHRCPRSQRQLHIHRGHVHRVWYRDDRPERDLWRRRRRLDVPRRHDRGQDHRDRWRCAE
jgi:hypothetical protein